MRARHVVLAGIVLCAAGATVLGLLYRRTLVDAARVTRGPLEVTIDEEGRTRVQDRYVVYAPVDALYRRIELEVGDPVGESEVIARLDPLPSTPLDPRARAEAEARVQAAEAAVTAAQEEAAAAAAAAVYADAQLERSRLLFESDDVSRDEFEQVQSTQRQAAATLRSAEFAAKVAQHELEVARAQLHLGQSGHGTNGDLLAVKAPAAGRVLAVHHESGGVVRAGTPLLEIGDPAALEVEVDVLSFYAVRIHPGMEVRFERWGGDEPLVGRVRVVEPTGFTKISALGVEEQRVFVICDITSPPEQWQRLGDGYRVEARFIAWRGEDVLRVPASALFREGGRWTAFQVGEDRARRVEVGIDHHNGLVAEVLSGLAAGDVVIVHPEDRVEDGTRVEVRALEELP